MIATCTDTVLVYKLCIQILLAFVRWLESQSIDCATMLALTVFI